MQSLENVLSRSARGQVGDDLDSFAELADDVFLGGDDATWDLVDDALHVGLGERLGFIVEVILVDDALELLGGDGDDSELFLE